MKSDVKNKLVTALISLAIAFGLWFYVITVVSPGSEATYRNIPIILQNEGLLEERGLMITDTSLPTVDLQLSGNRTDLNKLNNSNISVYVNLSTISATGEVSLTYDVVYPGDVPNNAITIESRKPDTVKLTVEERKTETIPVKVVTEGSAQEGFLADTENVVLSHEEVQISGPARVVSQIKQAQIRIPLEGKSESVNGSFEYLLCNENGEPVDVKLVTTNVEAVEVTLRIVRVKELPLTVTVIPGGGATEESCQIKLDPLTIQVSGSEAALEKLTELNLGTIDLSTKIPEQPLTFPINLPEGVTNETGVTEASVEVRFPNLRTKTLKINRINAVNVAAGKKADIITKVVEIEFRGPKALIDSIQASDVTVNVDFANAQPGTSTMPVEVILSDKYKDVGAVGSYTVSATLR